MIRASQIFASAFAVALFASTTSAADTTPQNDAACRKNLQQLATAIETFRLLHDKDPAKLSDLFLEGLVDDLRAFVCPASATKTILAAEIDAKSDYVLGEPGKNVVRERGAFHANGETLAVLADGTISAIGGKVATTTSPATPPPPRPPEKPATPTTEEPKPRRLTMKEILAAERGETAEVRALVAGNDPNARDQFLKRTALSWSIYLDDQAAFARLVAVPGADVNAVDDRDDTPLTIAVAHGLRSNITALAETLIAKGADVRASSSGMTVLMLAANTNAPTIARAVLAKLPASEVDVRGANGMTALNIAASVGAVDVVRQLLERGANIESADKLGATPLIRAATLSFPQTTATIKLLLEKGANPNARDNDGNTPLSAATARNATEVVALLRKAGAK